MSLSELELCEQELDPAVAGTVHAERELTIEVREVYYWKCKPPVLYERRFVLHNQLLQI